MKKRMNQGIAGDAPDRLALVSSHFDPDSASVVLVNPALFVKAMRKLRNMSALKFCGDGTFRLMQAVGFC